MELKNRTYTTADAIRLAYKSSPVCTALHVLLSVVNAVMPTTTALATAYFVDTAIAVLRNEQPRSDIYPPLILLLP